jgi:hypothetical protein
MGAQRIYENIYLLTTNFTESKVSLNESGAAPLPDEEKLK